MLSKICFTVVVLCTIMLSLSPKTVLASQSNEVRNLAEVYPKISNKRCNRRGRNSCLFGKRPLYCNYNPTIRIRRQRCYNKLDYSTNPDARKILFVGNSFTFYNRMPKAIFHNIADSLGHKVVVEDVGEQPAATLGYHRYSLKTKNGFEKQKKYDYVVLQEQSMFLSWENAGFRFMQSYQFADEIYAMVKAKEATPLLFLTWGYYRGIEFQDSYDKMQDRLMIGYKGLQDVLKDLSGADVPMAPVGEAWRKAFSTYGTSLYSGDAKHPSIHGSYLAALTMYCTIFKENPDNRATFYPRKVSYKDARQLQKWAWDACQQFNSDIGG